MEGREGGNQAQFFYVDIVQLEGMAPYRRLLLAPAGPLDSCKKKKN